MNEHVRVRSEKLISLGLRYTGSEFVYEDINFHYTDLLCMSDKEFEKALQGATERKRILEKNKDLAIKR